MTDPVSKQHPDFGPSNLVDLVGRQGEPPAADALLRITLDVDNGHSAERYHFHYEVSTTSGSTVEFTDVFRGVDRLREQGNSAQFEAASILEKVDAERLRFAARRKDRFPPGSLIGRLTISDGVDDVTNLFMADEEQAKTSGIETDPHLREILEAIYDAGAAQLGQEDIRP